MNRVDFIHAALGNKLPDYLVSFFDYLMALYNMIGGYSIKSINAANESGSVQFDIQFADSETVDKLDNQIAQNNNTICVYNRQFCIAMERRTDTNISIILGGC